MLGYATHPMVPCAVLVEHGCEKTHNDHFATKLKEMGEDPTKLGYAPLTFPPRNHTMGQTSALCAWSPLCRGGIVVIKFTKS